MNNIHTLLFPTTNWRLFTVWLFVFGTQFKIFGWKPGGLWLSHLLPSKKHCQCPEKYERHRLNSPSAISGSIWLLWSDENTYLLGSKWDSHKPPSFHPKYLKLCSKDEQSFYGLERHGGKWLKTKFALGWWVFDLYLLTLINLYWPHTWEKVTSYLIQKYAICMLIKNMQFGAVLIFILPEARWNSDSLCNQWDVYIYFFLPV